MPGSDYSDDPEEPAVEEDKYGVKYVFDSSVIPEIHISVPLVQWNRLLDMYDANPLTKQYVQCDVTYKKGEEVTEINKCGLRLKGHSSRRRPDLSDGHHVPGKLSHVHFALHFQKYIDDKAHSLHGCKSIKLKWFNQDPSYAREIFCYDLFRRMGVWTAINCVYCRLWVKIEGDPEETYYGVYMLEEAINKSYLKERAEQFGRTDGNLWKCRYGAKLNLTVTSYGVDAGGDEEYVYEYKMDEKYYEDARLQLRQFMLDLQKGDQAFHDWIIESCDVALLMKTYAINIAVGMWDDYWNNANNYYLYFDSRDKDSFRFFFIPYDYDISMGVTADCAFQTDAVRQNPHEWGDDSNPLIRRILKFDDFRSIFNETLLGLVAETGEMSEAAGAGRIRQWQERIREYVVNDTGEDMAIEDRPALWSSHPEYRLTEDSDNNYFRVKAESIRQYCTE